MRLGVAVGEKLEAVADAVVRHEIFVAKRQCHLIGWIVLTHRQVFRLTVDSIFRPHQIVSAGHGPFAKLSH